jgi:hypothetical protein
MDNNDKDALGTISLGTWCLQGRAVADHLRETSRPIEDWWTERRQVREATEHPRTRTIDSASGHQESSHRRPVQARLLLDACDFTLLVTGPKQGQWSEAERGGPCSPCRRDQSSPLHLRLAVSPNTAEVAVPTRSQDSAASRDRAWRQLRPPGRTWEISCPRCPACPGTCVTVTLQGSASTARHSRSRSAISWTCLVFLSGWRSQPWFRHSAWWAKSGVSFHP